MGKKSNHDDAIVILLVRFDLSEVHVFLTAEYVRHVANLIMNVHCTSISFRFQVQVFLLSTTVHKRNSTVFIFGTSWLCSFDVRQTKIYVSKAILEYCSTVLRTYSITMYKWYSWLTYDSLMTHDCSWLYCIASEATKRHVMHSWDIRKTRHLQDVKEILEL